MKSTMRESPLLVSEILRHGTTLCAAQTVVTATVDGYREATFEEIGHRVAQLAHGLRTLGISGDQRVATFMWNNQEHLEAFYAVPCLGSVLHTLNIRLSTDQISYIANEAEDQVVIVNHSLIPLLADVLAHLDTVHTVVVVGDDDVDALVPARKNIVRYDDLLAGQPTEFDWPELSETSPAAMCYTSGTTGDPKGVVYSHRSTVLHSMAVCTANAMAIAAGDQVLPIVPMFHANAWGLPHAAMMAGASLVMPDRYTQPNRLIAAIEQHKVTVAAGVPTVINDVAHYLRGNAGHDVSSLRHIICGGSTVPHTLMKEFEDNYGVAIRQAWGMTETSPLAAVAWPPTGIAESEHWELRNTAGRPVCGVETRIVADDGRVLPRDGESVGELEVRGNWVTASYFADNYSSHSHDGWLRTGDVGSINSRGFITLTDRAKDVIKSGGEWISSVELENHIMAHPAVVEACVVAVADSRWQERPLAAVVLNKGFEVTAAELRSFLSERVPRWQLPERWTFVGEVPRTSVGKFDKKAVRSRYAQRLFDVVICHD
ncbi:long-chain fatty acid--CoA ligase [Mycobacterium sp. 852002-51057_SCH5723018]|uniref:long-chain fatty acid--CoA ligase n=1 Tax=Mycobacterium sp. 852002-51057_SCH5723018 TaxID=1834094 RepID=UPI0007FDC2F3|nr:long-chain fatty acid--CoA ligase [Mycobacterium sp. 852002-51057_SCH5723018]OBG29511.1 long-chain fatty acid--CoA ligase [Mycobacterium sp. 852002-51057_SCH5723018]